MAALFIHRLISPMDQTCIRLLLNASVDPAVALFNSSVNPSIQPELKTDAQSKQRLSEQQTYDVPMYNR